MIMAKQPRRGPRTFTFTYDDIAELTGHTRRSVIQDAHPRKIPGKTLDPKFNPEDLLSVVHYVMRARLR